MKARLVIDVEECDEYYVDVYRKDDDRFEGRHYLKPMLNDQASLMERCYIYGWNDCLKEIEK